MAGQISHENGRVTAMSFCGSEKETIELGSSSRARFMLCMKREDSNFNPTVINFTVEEIEALIPSMKEFVQTFKR